MKDDDWKGSIFPQGERLKMAVKVEGKWRQVKTPYRLGQEKQAHALLKRTRELLKAGADAGMGPAPTVGEYAPRWLADRRRAGVASWDDDDSRLKTHILPALGSMVLGEVRPRHVNDMITAARRKSLAPKTIRNVYAVVRAMFRDAMIAGLAEIQPCILTHHQLGKVRDGKHEWRAEALFSADELRALMSSPLVPVDRQVLYGLLGLGCLRHGEAAALRWRHVVQAKPLNRLLVANSNDNDTTKTGVERAMPVHPALAALLAEWRMRGWPLQQERAPGPDDLVVPHPRPTNKGPRVTFGGMRSDHDSYKRLRLDCEALGFRRRRTHDLRRTGITLYREAGADRDRLQRCTHGASLEILEQYTTFGWEPLCSEIGKLGFMRRLVRPSGKTAKSRRK